MYRKRILWFNWRCIKNPLAGGAEVYTDEIAKRLVKKGYEILLVTSRFKNSDIYEVINNYSVLRGGNRFTIYLFAPIMYYKLLLRKWNPSIIIDEVNTIPFFTPLYVKSSNIVVLIHQLCLDCWDYVLGNRASFLGKILETTIHKLYVKYARKGKIKYIITVSKSTKNDLIKLGYPKDIVKIIYNAIDWNFYSDCASLCRVKDDLVVYIGRITPYKNLEDLLRAWYYVQKKNKKAKLVIAGRADIKYYRKLLWLREKLGLLNVFFKIGISSLLKKKLLAKAKILVYPSIREGWGQTILEAGACKTPAIAYDVPGLRDSIINNVTGILIRYRNVKLLGEKILELLENDELREKLGENAYSYSRKFTWEKSVNEVIKLLEEINDV